MAPAPIGSVLGSLISYCDHVSVKATTYLTNSKDRPSIWRSLPIFHVAMIFVIITALVCVFILDHLSKLLNVYLTNDNAKPATTPANKAISPTTSIMPQRKPGEVLTLTDLPAELRLQIYDLVVPQSHPYIVGRDYGHTTSRLRVPAICQVNRHVRAETLPLFYGGNTLIVDIHALKDLKEFLKWVKVLKGAEEVDTLEGIVDSVGGLGFIKDLRVTIGGCLLIDVILKPGRRKYGDERVVAAKPMLENSLKWDRKNILHYVQDPVLVKPVVEDLLKDVTGGLNDSGLRVEHLLRMVETVFKVEKVDAATRKVYLALKEI